MVTKLYITYVTCIHTVTKVYGLRVYGYFLRVCIVLIEIYPLVPLLRLNSHEKSELTADPPCWQPLTLAEAVILSKHTRRGRRAQRS